MYVDAKMYNFYKQKCVGSIDGGHKKQKPQKTKAIQNRNHRTWKS